MAIISIPSTIAGISIPGLSSKGPLGALFDNPFRQDILQYPRDLNSATKGHVVQFGILETIPVTFESISKSGIKSVEGIFESAKSSADSAIETYQNLRENPAGTVNTIKNNVVDSITSIGSSIKSIGSSLGSLGDDVINNMQLNFQPERSKVVSYISLYIPDTLNFTIDASYDELSLTNAIKGVGKGLVDLIPGRAQGKFASAVTSMVGTTAQAFGGLALGKAGYAVNPQMQVLFQSITFRKYQMAFIFTPYSRQEAETVEKIVKMFRMHASPRVQTGLAGMFFVAPSAFDVKFLFNGKENTHLNKIKRSVITSIDVNYSPNGWSAHDDGTPVQTTMTVQFKELELVDRNAVNQGY